MKNDAKKNLVFSVLTTIITIILGLIIPRLTIVSYGSEINGLLSSITQMLVYLTLFEAGISTIAKKALYEPVAKKDNNKISGVIVEIGRHYRNIGFLYLLGLIVISLVFSNLNKVESLSGIEVFLITFFSGLGNVISFLTTAKYNSLLFVDGKNYISTIINSITHIISSFIKVFLLSLKLDVVIIIISIFFVSLLQIMLNYIYIRKIYAWLNCKASVDKDCLRGRFHSFGHSISTLIFNNTDVLLLTFFCDFKIVSVYSLYKLITSQLNLFISIPWNSVSFAFGQLYHIDLNEYTKKLDAYDLMHNILCYSIYAVALFLFTPFIKIYTKGVNDVSYVYKFLPLLFVLSEVLSKSREPYNFTIDVAGHFKETLWRSILESGINIVVSIICVIYFGIYGVLIGTIAAMIFRTTDIIFYSNKKILGRTGKNTYIAHLINLLLMIVIQLIFKLIPIEINNYIEFIVMGLITTLISIIVYILVNTIFHKKIMSDIYNAVKNRILKTK